MIYGSETWTVSIELYKNTDYTDKHRRDYAENNKERQENNYVDTKSN